ncbi:unnamed protein product [Penicillium nalgiovense]|nr:unnamed protein product [Penicillium nalgiovense]
MTTLKTTRACSIMPASLAFVFPGQGSLSVGMLADFGAENPVIIKTFEEASKALGYNLWALVQKGPQEQLDQPEKAEPAILTVSIALWHLWLENGGPCPAFVSGHGFGEYSALVAVGSLSLETAVRLVESRARLMQATAELNNGAMATVLGLDDADVVAICGEAAKDQVVSVAYFNSPGQVVIAGHKAAVDRATELCKAKGAKRIVPTAGNVPSHCALMKPAAEHFSAMVNSVEWMTPYMPVVRNVTAAVSTDLDALKQDLMVELYQPVLWVECVQTLARNGVVNMVECGPGRALVALNKHCADGVTTYSINSPDQLATTRAALS